MVKFYMNAVLCEYGTSFWMQQYRLNISVVSVKLFASVGTSISCLRFFERDHRSLVQFISYTGVMKESVLALSAV